MPQILVVGASFFKVAFRISRIYAFFTPGSLGKVSKLISGEFLQLSVHPGVQQLYLTISQRGLFKALQMYLQTAKTTASPKTAP